MQTKILVIGVIQHENQILLRKKSQGIFSPYQESWYLFGDELNGDHNDPQQVLKEVLQKQANIMIDPIQRLSWDIEIKTDYQNDLTLFVYLDYLCKYVSGDLSWGEGIEELKWVPIAELKNYDLVPPSKKLFQKLKYL